MKLSTRSRYGTKMMCHIARYSPEAPVPLREISKQQDISIKYLEQLIVPLKNAGLIKSVRGPKGGYLLAKPVGTISMGEIVGLLEPEKGLARCIENPESCKNSLECVTRKVWARATAAMYSALNAITLEEIISQQLEMEHTSKI